MSEDERDSNLDLYYIMHCCNHTLTKVQSHLEQVAVSYALVQNWLTVSTNIARMVKVVGYQKGTAP